MTLFLWMVCNRGIGVEDKCVIGGWYNEVLLWWKWSYLNSAVD